jgi:hypothetical protein
VKLQQAILWAIVVFIVWFVISSPADAGSIVGNAFSWVSSTGHSFGNALHNLVS